MQPPRLSHLILLGFSEEKLAKMSSDEKYFEICGWDFWAEKARLELGVPVDYFNLPRNQFGLYFPPISGYQRYLHILSKFSFRPEFLLRYEGKQILGFHDVFKGIYESLRQNNPEAVEFYLSKMNPEQISSLKKTICQLIPNPYRFKALGFLLDRLFQTCPEEFFTKARRVHHPVDGIEFFLQQNPKKRMAEEKRDEELLKEFKKDILQPSPGLSVQIYSAICWRIEEGSWLLEEILSMFEKGQINRDKLISAFRATIRGGNVEKVEKFFHLHEILHLPPGLTKVRSVVSPTSFDPSRTPTTTEFDRLTKQIPKGKFHCVPIQSSPNSYFEKYLREAAYSCNPLLFDFFLSLGPISLHDKRFSQSLFRSLANGYANDRNRFVGAFEISQRLNKKFLFVSEKFDDDILADCASKCSNLSTLDRMRVVSFESAFSIHIVATRMRLIVKEKGGGVRIELDRERERNYKQNHLICYRILRSCIKVKITD